MSGSWKVDIPNCTLTFSYVTRGYVKCVVSSNTPPFQQRVFAFCMRCKDLGCVAWFYSHQDAQRFRSTGEMEDEFHARRQHFFEDIKSDVELLEESGTLFRQRTARPRHRTPRRQSEPVVSSRNGLSQNADQEMDIVPGTFRTVGQDEAPEDDDDDIEDEDCDATPDDLFARTAQSISDCFIDFCCLNKRFDASAFCSLARSFFDECCLTATLEKKQSDALKSRIISNVLKHIFAVLALTKRQTNTLNRLFKAVLLFVGGADELSGGIHASNLSCTRESEKKNTTKGWSC